MFEIAPVTPELLDALGIELGGCDFSHEAQKSFLENKGPCDIQAAPGNGKTTLLAAKLALLSRTWTSRRQGICVISHTNAARTEVEDLLAKHPLAVRFMAYPHFTGTVTAFINQFIALPYLRGLGWNVRQIDDDVFAAEALRRYGGWGALDWLANKAKHGSKRAVESWVTGLDLSPDFIDAGTDPDTLAVRRRKGQHHADKPCGIALAQLKAAMVRSGLYRYADMTALAQRALATTPGLAARLRARFPLVILDEAQDTNGDQLKLLEALFKDGITAFQRLGDQNQTLYEDDALSPADYWTAGPGVIPLDGTRRFGAEIASFASRLTARAKQEIVCEVQRPGVRVLFLFDEVTIGDVIGAYAAEARELWGDACAQRNVWAVASRHSIAGHKAGAWLPKSLVDYHPVYRSESGSRDEASLFCRQFQKASLYHAAERSPAEVVGLLAAALAELARRYGLTDSNARAANANNVWAVLAHRDLGLPRRIRRLFRDNVLVGNAPWEANAWHALLEALLPLLGGMPEGADAIADYCAFVENEKVTLVAGQTRSTKEAVFGDLTIRMGSIHSVKGKTVDGILVVESQVWKGTAAALQCMDLETVLPQAFGLADQGFVGVKLTAATSVFVAVTRPRELLGLAARKAVTTPQMIAAAQVQGWKVVDLPLLAAHVAPAGA
ncbi:UvrD-helicase domain-containing protein [Mesorhizobium sp. M0663]|uniref:UvrD-helicase domain-containing protein n=1 Tax=Mesorhizobium sp. M0663 TaxID=2956981 RepID=UPI00333540EA